MKRFTKRELSEQRLYANITKVTIKFIFTKKYDTALFSVSAVSVRNKIESWRVFKDRIRRSESKGNVLLRIMSNIEKKMLTNFKDKNYQKTPKEFVIW